MYWSSHAHKHLANLSLHALANLSLHALANLSLHALANLLLHALANLLLHAFNYSSHLSESLMYKVILAITVGSVREPCWPG